MKKIILISSIFLTLLLTGCDKEKKLECSLNDEINITTVKKGKIIAFKNNNEDEEITDEEWETLKNFYEFSDDVTTDDIINKLKELNESIGYTCKIK